ncbi:hypothetical protein [Aeromicrobium choanae]|uniref:hypothetical protein n=1 Tax=Aeromicrobium choanae TaxID=1736691 RepID=UPI0009992BD8|nr:hypothetical protein [Aeromicrobium choanae]
MIVSVVSGFAGTAWSILCLGLYASSDRQVISGVTFEPEPSARLLVTIGAMVGLSLLPALLGLAGLRGKPLGRNRRHWWLVSLIFGGWFLAAALDGGTTLLSSLLSLLTGLAAGLVALTLPGRSAARPRE